MTARELRSLEQHFLLSNRLVQFVLHLRSNENSRNWFFFFAVSCYFLSSLVYLIYELLTTTFNFDQIVVEIRTILDGLIVYTSYSIIYIHNVSLKLLLTRIIEDCEQLSDEEEIRIMEKYNKENKLFTYIIVVTFSFYMIVITSSSIFKVLLYLFGLLDSNELTLPFSLNSISNAGVLYYYMLIHQIISAYTMLIISVVCFSTYLVIVQHAICQFSIIILKIQRMFKSNEKYVSKSSELETKRLDEFNWMLDIIVSYKKLTEYVDLINYYSQEIYLITVFLAMLLVVIDFIYFFQLSFVWENLSKIIVFSTYVGASIFTIYINFYIGQKLLNSSEALFKELCQIPFYMLSNRTQYILLFLIRRSLKPCMLSIGGLFVSSHETFSVLVKKAYSLAMVYSRVK